MSQVRMVRLPFKKINEVNDITILAAIKKRGFLLIK